MLPRSFQEDVDIFPDESLAGELSSFYAHSFI